MENVEKSIIASSLIGTMFNEYEAGELNNTSELVKKRIGKYMRKRARTNSKLYIESVLKTDKVWQEAINHFAKQN